MAITKDNLGKESNPIVRSKLSRDFSAESDRSPFNFHIYKSVPDTTSETLSLNELEAGYFYIVTNIAAYEDTAGTPQIKLFINQKFSEENLLIKSGTIAAAEDSLSVQGEFNLNDSDKIKAVFESADAGGTVHLFVHGYKIKK